MIISKLVLATLLATNSINFNYNFLQVDKDYQFKNSIIQNDSEIKIVISPEIIVKKLTSSNTGYMYINMLSRNKNSYIDVPIQYIYNNKKTVAFSDINTSNTVIYMPRLTADFTTIQDLYDIFIYDEIANAYSINLETNLQVSKSGDSPNFNISSIYYYMSIEIKNKTANSYTTFELGVKSTLTDKVQMIYNSLGGIYYQNGNDKFKAANNSKNYQMDATKLNVFTITDSLKNYFYADSMGFTYTNISQLKKENISSFNGKINDLKMYFGYRTISDGAIAPPQSDDDLFPVIPCKSAFDIPCQIRNGFATLINNIPFISPIFKAIKNALQTPILLFQKLINNLFGLWI